MNLPHHETKGFARSNSSALNNYHRLETLDPTFIYKVASQFYGYTGNLSIDPWRLAGYPASANISPKSKASAMSLKQKGC
ncbi:hypothetical protein [Spirosoma jeollabukense]